ncbi:hypothetical protein [Nocardia sp. alder85J]|uniref:TPR repeat region-containing protein n=1 Tax=Nocardia sp. alder85J TaxID=2862949 RepID=UPI001CD41F72|nr:hypothetical protein [Nocardia sp. alder85J]MCX4092092.1 hypothetical protein [Nocardia sp. alder85J]
MSTPLSWLRTADPQILAQYAMEWEEIGTGLEGVYQKYVDAVAKVDDLYWRGKAAEAAQDRASGDLRTVQALADKLGGVAGQARTGAAQIGEALRKARGLLDECANKSWSVTEGLTVIGSGSARDLAQMNKDLIAAYHAAVATDQGVHAALQLTRSSLSVAFASAASLGGAQGKDDGKHLVTDPTHLTDVEIERLIDAGSLTDQQLADLHNGKPVAIPVAQMDYLNQLSRSMDDKSPEEIQAVVDKLPPNARTALENSLQLISNSNIGPAVKGGPGIPDRGGQDLLPKKIEESLTRADLVDVVQRPPAPGSTMLVEEVRLNGVKDNQIIAKLAGGADPRYRAGTALDKQVLDVGARYLEAQVHHEQDPGHNQIGFTVDGRGDTGTGLTEPIFAAVADDKAALQNLVVDANGKPNEPFLHDVLTHRWTDGGDAASKLFSFGDYQAGSVDAHRQAAIMSAVGQFAAGDDAPAHIAGSNDKWKLYDIPNTDHKTVGDLNPKLLQTLSAGMTPFIDDLTNTSNATADEFRVTYTDATGLHSWTDPSDNNTMMGSKNIFSLMDTDDVAGKNFNAAAMAHAIQAEVSYGQDPSDAHATDHLDKAGKLYGLVDSGLRDEISSHVTDAGKVAQDAYNQKKAAYDLIAKSAGYNSTYDGVAAKSVVGDQVGKLLGLGGDPLKNAIIGAPPSAVNNDIGLNPPNFVEQAYNSVASSDIPESLRHKYSQLFDSNGNILSWNEIQTMPVLDSDQTPVKQVTTLFNQLGPQDGHSSALENAYDNVTGPYRKNDGQTPHNQGR